MKLLITGGTALIPLKLLKAFESAEVVLADYGDVPMLHSKAYQMMSLGPKNEEIIAHNLLTVCLDAGVDWVLPLHAFELEALAKAKVLFAEFGIRLLLPDQEVLAQYLPENRVVALNEWAIYDSGKLFYANGENEIWQQQQNLTGAFTWANGHLSLITI